MNIWAELIGGTIGFIFGCGLGNNLGSEYWFNKYRRMGIVKYRLAFLEGIALGFTSFLLMFVMSPMTNIIPIWINTIIWIIILCVISGWIIGFFTLGRNVARRGYSNIKPSINQATLGAFLGLLIGIILLSIPN